MLSTVQFRFVGVWSWPGSNLMMIDRGLGQGVVVVLVALGDDGDHLRRGVEVGRA